MIVRRTLTRQRGLIALTGPDRVRFVHSMVTQDIESLRPGQGARAAMLTVKGRTVGELWVMAEEERLLLELEAQQTERIATLIEHHLVMDDVEVSTLSSASVTGLYSLGAAEPLWALLSARLGHPVEPVAPYAHRRVAGWLIVGAPELGVPGVHLIDEQGQLPEFGLAELAPLEEEQAEVLRIEAGRPRWGVEIDEERLILEANLDDAIHLAKGCYLGQEVVARATARGHVNRRLKGLRLEGDRPVARGSRLSTPERPEAGVVTSSVVSPRHGVIALAYVHRSSFADGTEVTVSDDATGPRRAWVEPLPFRASSPTG
jgi:folate-binding protein YgfZ